MKFFRKILSYFSEIVFVEVQSFSQACKLHIDYRPLFDSSASCYCSLSVYVWFCGRLLVKLRIFYMCFTK